MFDEDDKSFIEISMKHPEHLDSWLYNYINVKDMLNANKKSMMENNKLPDIHERVLSSPKV
jgi:hypothetical protein